MDSMLLKVILSQAITFFFLFSQRSLKCILYGLGSDWHLRDSLKQSVFSPSGGDTSTGCGSCTYAVAFKVVLVKDLEAL